MAAAYPPWVMFEHYCTREVQGCSPSIADDKTRARCLTTAGIPINVSLCLAAPPEGSRVCVQLPAAVKASYSIALAAHGDSVLIQVAGIEAWGRSSMTDHFVYNAGNAAADPPRPSSLSLLPLFDHGKGRRRYMDSKASGIVRRGEDEFTVAELDMHEVGQKMPKVAELRLLRCTGRGEWSWSMVRPPVSDYDGGGAADWLLSLWSTDAVIPVGGERLCWVDVGCGLLFSNVFDESPSLGYVLLPEDPWFERSSYRNVCVSGDSDAIKFVNIFPRCCCGRAGHSYCDYSDHAYTIHTWTLSMHDMAWVMDGTIDATDLWPLDGYKGLPCVQLDYPITSMDEPHVMCFMVCEDYHINNGDKTVFVIMVDMRSKTLRSIFCYPEGRVYRGQQQLLPSRVSQYFNSKQSSGRLGLSEAETVPSLANNISDNDLCRPACKSPDAPIQASSLAKILAALKEIPGLDRDDMLKAFRILQTSAGSSNGFKEGVL
ncbi:unnamed protein product [Urochloa decumbens]|uniref:DUF1618 domain-containing protein n=1 Tax=Urochloa decumbens TaxID=240449 RepID=A0ABC9B6T2_9POAL